MLLHLTDTSLLKITVSLKVTAGRPGSRENVSRYFREQWVQSHIRGKTPSLYFFDRDLGELNHSNFSLWFVSEMRGKNNTLPDDKNGSFIGAQESLSSQFRVLSLDSGTMFIGRGKERKGSAKWDLPTISLSPYWSVSTMMSPHHGLMTTMQLIPGPWLNHSRNNRNP